MQIRVKTLWQGQVGIRDRFIKEAKQCREGLSILYGDGCMTIPFEELEKRIVARSEESFRDRYSFERHYLFYYDWQPDKVQVKLL